MFKNPTPKQLAFYAALITTLTVFIAVIGINLEATDMSRALNIVLLPLLTFIVCFLMTGYLIDAFIYRRIKVIFKHAVALWKHLKTEAANEYFKEIALCRAG